MKTANPLAYKNYDLELEFKQFQAQYLLACQENKKQILLEQLPYDLHKKLIDENYQIKKIIKQSGFLWFNRKKKKYYIISKDSL